MTTDQPASGPAVAALEAAYGRASQSAFGSAVFSEHIGADDDLEARSRGWYRHFVGAQWDARGEATWLGPWREVYRRGAGSTPDIVAELRAISDREAVLSVPMLLDVVERAEQARGTLAAVYDDPAVTDLRVYNLGDGAAMSGLLVAGRHGDDGEATFLVFLMD